MGVKLKDTCARMELGAAARMANRPISMTAALLTRVRPHGMLATTPPLCRSQLSRKCIKASLLLAHPGGDHVGHPRISESP